MSNDDRKPVQHKVWSVECVNKLGRGSDWSLVIAENKAQARKVARAANGTEFVRSRADVQFIGIVYGDSP